MAGYFGRGRPITGINTYTKTQSDDRFRDSISGDMLPDSDSIRDIGSTSKRWAQGWFDDVTTDTADINGGTIDGTVIGGSTPAAISGTDLTLSGGVYLGGTGAANYLDDYEEGTWVPTYNASGTDFSSITYNTTFTYGTYVKIGPLVNLRGYIRTEAITVGSASGGVRIGNLPFTSSSGINSTTDIRSRGSCIGDNFAASAPSCIAVDDGSSYANLYTLNAVGSATSHSVTPAASAMSTGTAKNITTFTITYYTDS